MAFKIPSNRKEFLAACKSALKAQLRRLSAKDYVLRMPSRLDSDHLEEGLHLHPMAEISLQLVGQSKMLFARQYLISDPGDLLLIPAGVSHHELVLHPRQPFLNLVVRFHKDGVHFHFASFRGHTSPTIVLSEVFPSSYLRLAEYFDDAYIAMKAKGASAKQAGRCLLQAGFYGLLEILELSPIENAHEDPILMRCRMLVTARLSDPTLSVAALAAELQYSADHLSRLFHASFGETLSSYITNSRITYSMELLKKSRFSIKEVASATGYRSAGYFIRVFKQTQGTTPMEYRRGITSGFVKVNKPS